MGIFKNIKITFQNLSGRTVRRLVTSAVILCISVVLSLPALREDLAGSSAQKIADAAGDGIDNATPESQGMDGAVLRDGAGFLGNYPAMSLLVVRHGKIVLEKYYIGDKNSANSVFSISKSFVSALTGIAINDGLMGRDEPLEKYLPPGYGFSDPGWKDIKLSHLLTMTPGFLEDAGWPSGEDWIAPVLKLPLNFRPGEKFQYANSAAYLLSVALAEATGVDALSYAQEHIFGPLQFRNTGWATDPKGYYAGYAGMYLRPRDLAKFGLLYLNGGKWEGRQLVPEEWVKESTVPHLHFEEEAKEGYEDGYGYFWWINGVTGYHMFSAVGYGGQSIDVIPALDLVTVITSVPDYTPGVDNKIRFELLNKYIIPSIKDK